MTGSSCHKHVGTWGKSARHWIKLTSKRLFLRSVGEEMYYNNGGTKVQNIYILMGLEVGRMNNYFLK